MADAKPAAAGGTEDAAKAAADAAADATAKAAADTAVAEAAAAKAAEDAAKAAPKKGYVVVGAAVVLPIEGGSERYLYRGAPVGEGFTKEGIKHALSVGLIAKAK